MTEMTEVVKVHKLAREKFGDTGGVHINVNGLKWYMSKHYSVIQTKKVQSSYLDSVNHFGVSYIGCDPCESDKILNEHITEINKALEI